MRKLSIFLCAVFLFAACSNGVDKYEIEDTLQNYWNKENANHPIGAMDCNVFSVKITEVSNKGKNVKCTDKLRSTFSNGTKKIVDFSANLTKRGPIYMVDNTY